MMARYIFQAFFLSVVLLSVGALFSVGLRAQHSPIIKQTGHASVPWSKHSLLRNDSFRSKGSVALADGRELAQAKIQQGEIAFWQSVEKRGGIVDFQAYLDAYPNGHFAVLARNSIAAVRKAAQKTAAGEKTEQEAPEKAEQALLLDRAARRELQEMLTGLGYDTMGADGLFGDNTRKAIGRYQQAKQQPQTGYLTAQLVQQLREAAKDNLAEARRREKLRKEVEDKPANKARRRKELIASERKSPKEFWESVTPEDAALLVSDTSPKDWPVFALDEGDLEKGWSRLHYAASGGNEKVVRLLLNKGADIEALTEFDKTLLHSAASGGNEKVVRLLLKKGADIHARDKNQWTPLHLAARSGNEQIVRLLLEKGADIHARDKNQWTPLHRAASSGNEQIVRLLLEKGADIEARDGSQRTPLHWTAYQGHEKLVQLLLEKGADIEARNIYQNTPLHGAASSGNEQMVRLLLEKGADIHARDIYQNTPLHDAARWGREKTVRLLLEKGADIHTRDKTGETALDVAKRKGYTKIVEVIFDRYGDSPDKPSVSYRITQDESLGNIKRTVEVEIDERIDEDTLRNIAKYIKSKERRTYQRTFIGYRMKGSRKDMINWATTHYDPDLKVEIIGADKKTYEAILSSQNPKGEIIGSWMAEYDRLLIKLTIYKKEKTTRIRSIYMDGTSSDREIKASVLNGKKKFQLEGETYEYFLLNSAGELEFWSENRNYHTAKKRLSVK